MWTLEVIDRLDHRLDEPVDLSRWRVALPVGLIFFAVAGIALVTFGLRPQMAELTGGVEIIVFVRNLQWPLVGLSLLGSMTLVTLVIANKCSATWLTGLIPVLMLFVARFGGGGAHVVHDLPQFVDSAHPGAPQGEEWVVGVVFNGQSYAFPYRALNVSPIVVVTDYSKRMMLMWSASANRCVAVSITRDLRPRSLEVVSTPADGLLIHERRYGQFISSITGKRTDQRTFIGFAGAIPVTKTLWANWRAAHPQTRAMLPAKGDAGAVAAPLRPTSEGDSTPIALLSTDPPLAVPSELGREQTLNVAHGDARVLVFRDPKSGVLRAYERRVAKDLVCSFAFRTESKESPQAVLIDADTNSLWTADGRALAGPLKDTQLREIDLEDGLYWDVMRFWMPDLKLLE